MGSKNVLGVAFLKIQSEAKTNIGCSLVLTFIQFKIVHSLVNILGTKTLANLKLLASCF